MRCLLTDLSDIIYDVIIEFVCLRFQFLLMILRYLVNLM